MSFLSLLTLSTKLLCVSLTLTSSIMLAVLATVFLTLSPLSFSLGVAGSWSNASYICCLMSRLDSFYCHCVRNCLSDLSMLSILLCSSCCSLIFLIFRLFILLMFDSPLSSASC